MKKRFASFIVDRLIARTSRNRQVVNLKDAESVGIIFLANTKQACKTVNSFAETLREAGIKTEVVGFINRREPHDFHLKESKINFFTLKNCYWYGRPKDFIVRKFVVQPFSMLIDLSLKDHLPTKYIAGRSAAGLKVGAFGNSAVDIMIDVGKNTDLENFIQEVIRYTNILTPGKKSNEQV